MDCSDYTVYLGAFADGELDAEKNARTLEHLEVCRVCAAKVAGVRQLKKGLARVFADEHAPTQLQQRVHDAILSVSSPPASRVTRARKWVIPLGMAAAIAVVWIASLFLFDPTSPTDSRSDPIEAQWVRAALGRHDGCSRLGLRHHRESLPRLGRSIALQLTRELGFNVIVPDLSQLGFRLHSADTCGFGGLPGAHIIYERVSDNRLVSLFSVRHLAALSPDGDPSTGKRHYYVGNGSNAGTVVAWHSSAVTYLLCGKLSPEALIALADGTR